MNRAAIEWARQIVLAGDPAALSPRAVLFLLRDYITSGADVARDAVEQALTRGLSVVDSESEVADRLAWLRVLAEAAAWSDDERLRDAVATALPPAVDALETRVRRSYEPGEGLLDGSCADHLAVGSALLAGFDLSARLPYAMLAEELTQHARRVWWRAPPGAFDADFAANCAALHVCCRLSALHADAEYRASAVLAPTSPYRDDARLLAEWTSHRSGEHPQFAGDFGGALLEWFALEGILQ
ncbi:MAG TPA: hypothetical protein VM032_12200 [Vicinamibacterales bacterium]|nr:hypothetical protein [Vicinamibacterales bacterium]